MLIKRQIDKFTWVDVIEPTEEELKSLISDFSLHENAVEDCLDPEHLPKIEKFDSYNFLISRYADIKASKKSSTTRQLTRKIATFISDQFIITIQRSSNPFWAEIEQGKYKNPWEVFFQIQYKVIESYNKILQDSMIDLESVESKLFDNHSDMTNIQNVHNYRRKHTVLRHLFELHKESISQIPLTKEHKSSLQDLKEEIEKTNFKNSSLIEESSGILQLYLSVSSHKTNEVVRLLTVVSVFFMPLTFIVGVYGMNFKHMPELDSPYGYPAVWGVLILVILGLLIWFRKRKMF